MSRSQLSHHLAGPIAEAFFICRQFKGVFDGPFDQVGAFEYRVLRIIFRSLENRQMRDEFVPVFSRPGIKTAEEDFVCLEDGVVVDGSFLRQKRQGIFDTGFEGKVFGLFYFNGVFQFERVLKIASVSKSPKGSKVTS